MMLIANGVAGIQSWTSEISVFPVTITDGAARLGPEPTGEEEVVPSVTGAPSTPGASGNPGAPSNTGAPGSSVASSNPRAPMVMAGAILAGVAAVVAAL